MLDPLLQGLDVAEHHRGRRDRRPARARPDGRRASRRSGPCPLVIALRTRSTRISPPPPGRLPSPASLSCARTSFSGILNFLREEVDLRRAEAVDVDPREVGLDVAEQVHVPVERQVGVQAALHQDLVAAELDRLADLLEQDVAVEDVGLGVADLAVEGAEVADRGADVGVVDVAVDVVRAVRLGVEPLADRVGGPAEREEVGATGGARRPRRTSAAPRQRRVARSRRRWKTRSTPSGARPRSAAIPANRRRPAISGSPRS